MDSPTYIQNAIRTESVPKTIDINQIGFCGVLGLAIISAKIVDLAKKKIFYGKDIDAEELLNLCANLSEGAGLLAKETQEGADMNKTLSDQELKELDATEFDTTKLNVRALHASMGCFTESGELLESMVKQLVTGELDLVNFGEEIGDIEWYQAIGFDESKVTEASCREKNIAKLRKRYPEKFNADQAINRDLAAERKELE